MKASRRRQACDTIRAAPEATGKAIGNDDLRIAVPAKRCVPWRKASADFERGGGGTEGNRGCFRDGTGPSPHTQNERVPRVSCEKRK